MDLRTHCAVGARAALGCLLVCATLVAHGAAAKDAAGTDEARTAARLESLRASPSAMYGFLRDMPKGADLHMHLSGAVYAETFLQNAAEDNLCVDPVKLVLLPNRGPHEEPSAAARLR